jgi:hypothetical protein
LTLRRVAVGVILFLLAATGGAIADTRADAARTLDDGVARYRAADYQAALVRFQRAYAVFPSPKILFNIAITLDALRRPAEAAQAYQLYLALAAPGGGEADRRARVARAALQRLGARPGQLQLGGPPGPREIPARRRTWAWLAVGTSIGLAGGGVVARLSAGAADRDARDADRDRDRDLLEESADDRRTVSTILFAGAGAAALTAGALFFLEDRGAALSVKPTGGGMTVGIRGTMW